MNVVEFLNEESKALKSTIMKKVKDNLSAEFNKAFIADMQNWLDDSIYDLWEIIEHSEGNSGTVVEASLKEELTFDLERYQNFIYTINSVKRFEESHIKLTAISGFIKDIFGRE